MKSLKHYLERTYEDHIITDKVSKYLFHEKITLAS